MTSNQFAFSRNPLRALRRVVLRFFQQICASMGADHPFFYTEESHLSKLQIVGDVPVVPDAQEKRPVIVYSRANTQWVYAGMGAGASVQHSLLSGDPRKKNNLVQGTIFLHCCSRTMDEAEELAWFVSMWVQEFKELLFRAGFYHLNEPSVSAVSPAPDALVRTSTPEWLVCTVAIPYHFQYQWISKQKEVFLRGFEVELLTEDEELRQDIVLGGS